MDAATLAGIVSAALALASLFVGLFQAYYQYYTNESLNALGAKSCNERVMGPWARSTRQRFHLRGFRFETIFQAPVFFVCPPTNSRGPVAGEPICYVDGSPESYAKTRTPDARAESDLRRRAARGSSRPYTANERATWVTLLLALQRMEQDSRTWQSAKWAQQAAQPPPPAAHGHTLMVAVQPHWYSWDFMPRVLRKPYAVTTLSHLVEMAAMLGVHWKVFDRAGHHYQAEGNGFLLSGTYDPDVGICFDLQQVRSPIFGARRIVPVDEVKDLCFGYVPTIFHPQGAPIYRRLIEQRDSDDDKFEDGLSMLSLGSDGETAETMLSLGLTMDATRFFTDSDRRLAHLFPVHFELIGMLARNLHIPHSLFRYLPNPVPHRWDRRAFSVLQLLNAFCAEMNALGPPIDLTPLVATAHHVLQRSGSDCRRPASECHCAPCLEALSDALSACDQVLADEEIRETVLDVLARHFTQVLLLLNGHLELEDDPLLEDLTRGRSPRRERALMRLYFVAVRPAVTRLSDVGGDDDDGERRGTRGGVVVPPWSPDGAAGAEAPVGEKRPPTVPSRLAIWCYLVFRMLCWLQLHDFHKDDVMLPRSSLTGSRLQAYIL